MTARKASSRKRKTRLKKSAGPGSRDVTVGVCVMLSNAEIREFRARAEADMRSMGNYTAWLVLQDLERPRRRRRRGRSRAGGTREGLNINIMLSAQDRKRLERRAAEELRAR
jgi:hypothetical protein